MVSEPRRTLMALILFVGALWMCAEARIAQTPPQREAAVLAVEHLPFTPGDPKTAISTALVAAKKDGQRVLVNFGADWCIDCRILERLFLTNPVNAFLKSHFHVVTIDVGVYFDDGREKNVDVPIRYGLDLMTSGVPAIVVLDPEGRIVATTREGQWRSARKFTTSDVMPFLEAWAKVSPKARNEGGSSKRPGETK